MVTIDLNTINFEPAPVGFDQSGTLFNTLIADLDDGRQIIIAHDLNSHKSSIALGETATGPWSDSSSTQDWPALDRAFGRKQWQEFVAKHQQQAQEELEADLDDEE